MPFTFKIGAKIKEAWVLYKENFSQVIALALIVLAIQILSQSNSRHGNNLILTLILFIISIFISYIWIRSILKLLDGKGFNPFSRESLPGFAQIWDFVKTNILVALCVIPFFIIPAISTIAIVIIGRFHGLSSLANILVVIILSILIVLFIIPAIYVGSRLFPAKYISIEKYQGARKNVKEAWEMTRGNGWRILWKSFVIGLFIILGFLALVVGSIITYPIGIIISVMMYRELVKFKSAIVPEAVKVVEVPVAEVKAEEVK